LGQIIHDSIVYNTITPLNEQVLLLKQYFATKTYNIHKDKKQKIYTKSKILKHLFYFDNAHLVYD